MEEIKEAKILEENEIKSLEKPEFKNDIKAELKGITKIEDNINDVKDYALKLSKYYSVKEFDEETLKDAKSERAEVNKFKEKVADFRKEITKRFNEPLNKFIDTAKETEGILKETYDTINNQIKGYEEKQKEEKTEEVKDYFNELCESEEIDFVSYEQANINVTLSASMKSLKEQAKVFVDKICDDLKLIDTQEHKAEILAEYKITLNVSNAITTVTDRIKREEEEKAKLEQTTEQELNDEIMLEKIENISAPKEIVKEETSEEVFEMTFKVRGTKEKLKAIKEFLENGGYDYE